ncbi:MAG: alkaline phosphatase [Bacteroidetes bacterium]|nr:alkaline phosphatase [Bacteroidota bacterium]
MKKNFYSLFLSVALLNTASFAQTGTHFNDGYITVYKATSASALTNTGTAIVAEEYNTTTPAQAAPNFSVAIPTASGNKLVVSGTATASGGISRSENGRYLLMPGYNGLVGDANSTFTTNGAVRTINASGTVGAGIAAGGTLWLSSSNNLRGATSDDGTNYWISGNGVGVQTSSNGTTITTVSATSTNNRDVVIYNGQLYLTTGAGSQGIYAVGTGKPVTSGQTSTRLFVPTNTDPYAFSISPDGKTIYYVAASGGGIYRSTFNGTVWTGGTQIFSGTGYTGLAVDWNNYTFNTAAANGARIFACNPSTIVAANDNGTITTTTTILRTEPVTANNAFRQITFSPSKQSVSLGTNSPVAGTINTSTADAVLFQFNLSADEGNSTLKKLILNQSGTATIGVGNDISNFKLIEDANNNGVADAGELAAVFANGTVAGSNITFSNINLAAYINEGASKNFIVTGDLAATATVAHTFIPAIVSDKILNGINYSSNISNAGGSWINIGATPPTGNTLTINAPASTNFTLGNIVVVKTTGSVSKAGSAVTLNEYTTGGAPTISIAIPATGATPLQMAAGSGGSEGFLTRNTNGTALTLAGYSTDTASIADITVTASNLVPRVIFKVDGTGAYTQIGSSNTNYTGNDIRGAISDGTNYWAFGASVAGVDGIDYYGPSAATALGISSKAYGLQIFNGQIYFSTQKVVAGVTPNFGIYALGTGMPISGSGTPVMVINTGSATPTDFSFNPGGTICYIAINLNTPAGGIQKWVKTAGTWNIAYTLGTGVTNIGAYGLVVDYSGSNPVIYASTFEAGTTGNRIIKITDTGAASTAGTLIASTPNTFFHGVAFAPSTTCVAAAQPAAFTASADTVYNGQNSVTYTVPNDASVFYTWSYSGTGATIHGNGNSVTIDFSVSATSGMLNVIATNACGTSSATTKNVSMLPLPGTMRITEYMYNGSGSGAGEFVEFTNVGTTPVNMAGWSFDDNSRTAGSQSLSGFGTVQPGESVVFTDVTASAFRSNWALCSGIKVIGGNSNNLGREDEINLYNSSNTLIDRLTYGDQTYSVGSIRTTAVSGWVNAAGLGNNIITDWTLSAVADAEASYTSGAGEIGSPGKSSRAIVAYNPCLVTNGSPTIVMNVSSTTNYIDNAVTVAPTSPFPVSAVISDPTDPAKTLGIDFTINDAETVADSLTITATSSNTGVVPNANISISGSSANRNIKIIPIGIGYATITIIVSDGTTNTSYLLSYAASAASATPAATFWHTGMSDGSDGFALDDNYYISADDELDVLNVYSRAASGLPFVSYDYSSNLALPDPTKPEVDVEAATGSPATPDKVYWLGSMSNGKAPFNDKPNRNRIFATTHTGTGASTAFTFAGYYGNLRQSLITWGDAHGYNFTASAAAGVDSKTVSGFAAEGMVFGPDNTTLYIAFRAPLVPVATRTKAVIAPIVNFETWFNNGSPVGNPVFGSPIELDLGGRGFRDLTRLSNGTYIIVAGNPAGSPLTSAIYKWTGNAADAPIMITTAADGLLNLEGVMPVNTAGHLDLNKLQVISDGGDEDLYADGNEAKDFNDLILRKFRSDNLTAIDLCMTSTGDTTVTACNNFTWHGITYSTSGTPTHLMTGVAGCDSVVTLHLTINTLPANTVTANSATTFCQGDSVTFTTVAGNNYQWQLNGSDISGAVSNFYTAHAAGNYSVIVTSASSCVNTSSAQTVTVNALPDNSVTAGSATTFCAGGSVTFTAATGNSYQWQLNGSNIGGATANAYTANASGNYSVVVTNASTCINTSNAQIVTVNVLPDNSVTAGSATTFCAGGSVTFTAATGNSYQWQLNGSDIGGATANMYTANASGNYSVVVTNASTCTNTSSAQTVTVNALPDNSVTVSGATTFCQGDSVILTAANGLNYQWMLNGINITGATADTYTAAANGNYSVTVSNATCPDTSAVTSVTVNALPSQPVITQVGNTLTSTAASGYQWYYNGAIISGATSQTYEAALDGNYMVVASNTAGCEAASDTLLVTVTGIASLEAANSLNIYPNPYAGSTSIQLTLADNAMVTMEVYSMIGEKVQTLAAQNYSAGTYTFTFGAKQQGYAGGVYFVKTTINGSVKVNRIVEN